MLLPLFEIVVIYTSSPDVRIWGQNASIYKECLNLYIYITHAQTSTTTTPPPMHQGCLVSLVDRAQSKDHSAELREGQGLNPNSTIAGHMMAMRIKCNGHEGSL